MLGPLLVLDRASWSAIRAGQQRVVAAVLLIESGRAVPVERLVASARHAMADGRPDAAAAELAEGLALWRGPALAGTSASPAATAEAERLEQLRLAAAEDWLGVLLELGKHADVVDEARRLVREHPLRERLRARLMLALHRGGRRAEALDAYQRARRVLVDE